MSMTNSPFMPGARLAAYLRDSGGDEQDLSIPQQETHIQTWCQDQGYQLNRIFKDEAKTGSTTVGRNAFYEMLQHFAADGCQETGVVLWSFARFSRDIDDAQYFKAQLRRRGVEIYAITDPVPAGLDGRFFEAAIDWSNSRRLEELSKEAKRGLHYLVDQHGALGGTPPKGFMRVPVELGKRRDGSAHVVHRWDHDPELAPIVKKAWQMRAEGRPYREIHEATGLYSSINGYPTFFRNPIYIGTLHFGETVIERYCEPMIDKHTWDRVQELNRQHKKIYRNTGKNSAKHPRRKNSSYLLSGLAFCSRCGSPLNGHTIKKRANSVWYYYQCSRAKRSAGCDAPNIPRFALENQVIHTLIEYILIPDNLKEITEQIAAYQAIAPEELQTRADQLAAQLKETGQAAEKVIDTITETGHNKRLVQRLKELETLETDLAIKLEKVNQQLANPPRLPDPQEITRISEILTNRIKTASPEELRPILNALIEKIHVSLDMDLLRGEIVYYNPYAYVVYPHPDTQHSPTFRVSFGSGLTNKARTDIRTFSKIKAS